LKELAEIKQLAEQKAANLYSSFGCGVIVLIIFGDIGVLFRTNQFSEDWDDFRIYYVRYLDDSDNLFCC
jgi:hypothetical protein